MSQNAHRMTIPVISRLWVTRKRGGTGRRVMAIALAVAVLLFGSVNARVYGASSGAVCPSGMSQLDCDSLYGSWVNWVPDACAGSGSGDVTLVGSDGLQQAYNFFISQGLSNIQAAATVGNLDDESSLNPTIMQKGGNSNNPADADPLGWGIAQWTPGSKITGIAQGMNITGPIYSLATQLQIVWKEMTGTSPTGYSDLAQPLKQMNNLAAATSFFQHNFEGGIDGQRQADAQTVLGLYGKSGGNSGSTVGAGASSSCGIGAGSCTKGAAANAADVSTIRQDVVACAQQELSLWKSQSGYNASYPGFSYAKTGFLKYTQGRYEEWCADFSSWIYNQAGDPLQQPDADIPAVVNIQAVGKPAGSGGPNGQFHWHPAGSGYTPQPGDLAIHGGDHVNIFISSTAGVSTYIGGDQMGVNEPNGTYGTQNPPSGSIVSIETGSGYWANGITGYISPN